MQAQNITYCQVQEYTPEDIYSELILTLLSSYYDLEKYGRIPGKVEKRINRINYIRQRIAVNPEQTECYDLLQLVIVKIKEYADLASFMSARSLSDYFELTSILKNSGDLRKLYSARMSIKAKKQVDYLPSIEYKKYAQQQIEEQKQKTLRGAEESKGIFLSYDKQIIKHHQQAESTYSEQFIQSAIRQYKKGITGLCLQNMTLRDKQMYYSENFKILRSILEVIEFEGEKSNIHTKLIYGGGTGFCSTLFQDAQQSLIFKQQTLQNFTIGDVDCKLKFSKKDLRQADRVKFSQEVIDKCIKKLTKEWNEFGCLGYQHHWHLNRITDKEQGKPDTLYDVHVRHSHMQGYKQSINIVSDISNNTSMFDLGAIEKQGSSNLIFQTLYMYAKGSKKYSDELPQAIVLRIFKPVKFFEVVQPGNLSQPKKIKTQLEMVDIGFSINEEQRYDEYQPKDYTDLMSQVLSCSNGDLMKQNYRNSDLNSLEQTMQDIVNLQFQYSI